MSKEEVKKVMMCPKCKHLSITTNKDGTSFCRYCGFHGPTKEFDTSLWSGTYYSDKIMKEKKGEEK